MSRDTRRFADPFPPVDGSIGQRLGATGSVINIGGPDEFAAAIKEQSATIAATVKAIDFKPRN